MALGLADELLERHPRPSLADPAVWILESEGFRARTGPFSALGVLADWDASAGFVLVRELGVTVGPHPHCASAPVPSPEEVAGLRRVSVQPVGSLPCPLWWSIDLFLTGDGRIAAVTLDLWEP